MWLGEGGVKERWREVGGAAKRWEPPAAEGGGIGGGVPARKRAVKQSAVARRTMGRTISGFYA